MRRSVAQITSRCCSAVRGNLLRFRATAHTSWQGCQGGVCTAGRGARRWGTPSATRTAACGRCCSLSRGSGSAGALPNDEPGWLAAMTSFEIYVANRNCRWCCRQVVLPRSIYSLGIVRSGTAIPVRTRAASLTSDLPQRCRSFVSYS